MGYFADFKQRRKEAKDQAALAEIERLIKKFSSLRVAQDALLHLIVQRSSADDLVRFGNIAGRIAHAKERYKITDQ